MVALQGVNVQQALPKGSWTWPKIGRSVAWGVFNGQAFRGHDWMPTFAERLIYMGEMAYRTWNHANLVLSPGKVKFIKYSGIGLLIPYVIAAGIYETPPDDKMGDEDSQSYSRGMLNQVPRLVVVTDIFLSCLEFRKRPIEVTVEFLSIAGRLYETSSSTTAQIRRIWRSTGHFIPWLLIGA